MEYVGPFVIPSRHGPGPFERVDEPLDLVSADIPGPVKSSGATASAPASSAVGSLVTTLGDRVLDLPSAQVRAVPTRAVRLVAVPTPASSDVRRQSTCGCTPCPRRRVSGCGRTASRRTAAGRRRTPPRAEAQPAPVWRAPNCPWARPTGAQTARRSQAASPRSSGAGRLDGGRLPQLSQTDRDPDRDDAVFDTPVAAGGWHL